jgi:hypothetical protein
VETGFYFPDSWKKDPAFKRDVSTILRDVHQTVFNGKDPLTQQERKDFIEITYALLEPYLMQYSECDTCNISCKDAIDRAGKNNSLLMYLGMIVQGKTGSTKHQNQHRVLTHAAAYWVKKQPIVEGRAERLNSAFGVLQRSDVQQRIAASPQITRIDHQKDFEVKIISNQWTE